jgi:peptidoglycan/xylan/chitin deacetylase (PgdA/CDA1 family)
MITLIVIICLVLDYKGALRQKMRPLLSIAIIGMCAGVLLTLGAVLPGSHLYGPVFSSGTANQKIVALTFDDGPYPPYTDKILDILKEKNVKATFFIIGQNAAKHPETIKRIFNEGHQLGNHTYTHKDLLKTEPAAIMSEIERTNSLIYALTGQNMRIARPPHGFRDAVVLNIMALKNLKPVDWSVSGRDWNNHSAKTIAERVISNTKNGSVILLHDGDASAAGKTRESTVKALEKIIDELLSEGYRFVTIDEMLRKERGAI